MTCSLESVCRRSDDVVARDIEGEVIIVPLTAGIGDLEDELYSLNETGRAIWNRFDGCRSIRQIAADLTHDFDAPADLIESEVIGLAQALLSRRILISVPCACERKP